ncbi:MULTISPECIES: helix-turn-helix transcriptional regulator [unclassified Dehalobacter]|uniref:helix-turn-helix domain-containing protein n=1 Tax=unclassified Dehalobacter TaxID=2635733 RepID=UPI000E6B98A7|nr:MULTISPECIES: helix-turn-helix transcriptional regulator [unclassified Dehalobacter]RJE46518.1 transcriptional regulator [Dehalobacter sp. MCB1]TCX49468.1 transcriptional regulator [Dehalobacter sp. 12DCB1]TCX49970.1 transcriptional regulator [Dehalobacter sp. 14DCB1]
MTIGKVVADRIRELCTQKGITLNKLGTISGVTQSTLNNIISGISENPTISTIKKICDGLNINIVEFFDTPAFRNLEQEIK